MQHQTGHLDSVSSTSLFTQQWLPDTPPTALVILVHGIGEHSSRYAHLAHHLTGAGYGLCALDHRGHGRSAGERVLVADFEATYVADLRRYVDSIQAAWPNVPLVLYGHSMGSLIALLFAFRYQDELAGLITSGTAFKPATANAVTVPVLTWLNRLMPHARLIALDSRSLSHDPAVIRAYQEDPLVYHGRYPLQTMVAFQRAVAICIDHLPQLRLPYLVLHGGADPLTRVQGAEIVRTLSGSPDTHVIIYEGLLHEIHNESEQDRVFQDVTDWLDSRIIESGMAPPDP